MNNSELSPRNCMYRLLASFYAKELTAENINSIQSGDTAKLMDALEEVDSYAPKILRLRKFFTEIRDSKEAALDLAESYAWLFHGVAGPQAAHLTASVYLSQNGNILQEPEARFFDLLTKYRLSFRNYANEPCDHLAVILEFVAWLDEKARSAKDSSPWQKEQELVIEKYLLSWLPDFAARCKQADRLGFYAALAEDTLAFVTEDARQLQRADTDLI